MTDDARLLTEGELVRMFKARHRGGMCANCGRTLTDDEPVWVESLDVVDAGRFMGSYRAPVGRECASPTFVQATEGREPERCARCGRGVYYRGGPGRRQIASCSRWCASRYYAARAKEGTGS